MATVNIDSLTVVTAVSKPQSVIAVVGVQGPSGTSGADISPDIDNQLQEKPNGLYVGPLQYTTVHW